jgi:hypothetical protein
MNIINNQDAAEAKEEGKPLLSISCSIPLTKFPNRICATTRKEKKSFRPFRKQKKKKKLEVTCEVSSARMIIEVHLLLSSPP